MNNKGTDLQRKWSEHSTKYEKLERENCRFKINYENKIIVYMKWNIVCLELETHANPLDRNLSFAHIPGNPRRG